MNKKSSKKYKISRTKLMLLLIFLISIIFLMISYGSNIGFSPDDVGYKLGIWMMLLFVMGLVLVLLVFAYLIYYLTNEES